MQHWTTYLPRQVYQMQVELLSSSVRYQLSRADLHLLAVLEDLNAALPIILAKSGKYDGAHTSLRNWVESCIYQLRQEDAYQYRFTIQPLFHLIRVAMYLREVPNSSFKENDLRELLVTHCLY